MKTSKKIVIGIDEAGRGPLAGPVSVCAFAILDEKAKRLFRGAKESKQLSETMREKWFGMVEMTKKNRLIDYHVCLQSHRVIDSKGIAYAIRKALALSLRSLNVDPAEVSIILDGGLKAPPQYRFQQTIIRGDEKRLAIALASICAKVTRDRYMKLMARRYPTYGFEIHKGYGTKRHCDALKIHGRCPIHRKTFLKRFD